MEDTNRINLVRLSDIVIPIGGAFNAISRVSGRTLGKINRRTGEKILDTLYLSGVITFHAVVYGGGIGYLTERLFN